jgi:hypothetical protein
MDNPYQKGKNAQNHPKHLKILSFIETKVKTQRTSLIGAKA